MYDAHTHFIPPDVTCWLQDHQSIVDAKWLMKAADKAPFLSIRGRWEFELKEAFIDPDLYLEQQERAGIRHALVSPIPQLFLYEMDAAITYEMAQVYNDSLARWVKAQPERLSALATLPMNAPETAARELERAMRLGLRGGIVASSWSGHLLSEDRFRPFWECANALSAILFIHPLLSTDSRLASRMMPNLIGVPWETTVCAADLLLSGHLQRYPNVRILLAHGGGFLPYQLGRLEKGYDQWPAVSAQLDASPRELAGRFWYDSVLWNPASRQLLIDTVGEERIVPGSDFPFDLCEWPPSSAGAGFERLLNKDQI